MVSQKLEIKPVGQQSADRSLEVLKSNTDQAIEQKVESFVEQICEKLTPEIVQRLRSPEEQQVEVTTRITSLLPSVCNTLISVSIRSWKNTLLVTFRYSAKIF